MCSWDIVAWCYFCPTQAEEVGPGRQLERRPCATNGKDGVLYACAVLLRVVRHQSSLCRRRRGYKQTRREKNTGHKRKRKVEARKEEREAQHKFFLAGRSPTQSRTYAHPTPPTHYAHHTAQALSKQQFNEQKGKMVAAEEMLPNQDMTEASCPLG